MHAMTLNLCMAPSIYAFVTSDIKGSFFVLVVCTFTFRYNTLDTIIKFEEILSFMSGPHCLEGTQCFNQIQYLLGSISFTISRYYVILFTLSGISIYYAYRNKSLRLLDQLLIQLEEQS